MKVEPVEREVTGVLFIVVRGDSGFLFGITRHPVKEFPSGYLANAVNGAKPRSPGYMVKSRPRYISRALSSSISSSAVPPVMISPWLMM